MYYYCFSAIIALTACVTLIMRNCKKGECSEAYLWKPTRSYKVNRIHGGGRYSNVLCGSIVLDGDLNAAFFALTRPSLTTFKNRQIIHLLE